MLARDDRVANRKALRRQDIGELAVVVFRSARKRCGSIVSSRSTSPRRRTCAGGSPPPDRPACGHRRGNARDTAIVVAAAARVLAFGQALHRLALVETRAINQHQLTLARRCRIVSLERQSALPLTARWSRRCGDPLPGSLSLSSRPPAYRGGRGTPPNLPLRTSVFTALDLDVEQLLDRFLTAAWSRYSPTLKTTRRARTRSSPSR